MEDKGLKIKFESIRNGYEKDIRRHVYACVGHILW